MCFLVGAPAQASDVIAIDVSGPRPLADAATRLSTETGWIINYEDVPILWSAEVKDWGPEDAARTGAPTTRALPGPLGGRLSLSIARAARPDAALATLLAAYAATGSPGRFEVRRDGESHSLVPVTTKDASGVSVAATVLLDTPVTLPAGERTVAMAIEEVCIAVNEATGQQLGVGPTPIAAFHDTSSAVTSSGEPARAVLSRILGELDGSNGVNGSYAWHLYSTPAYPRVHGLNFRFVHDVSSGPETPR